MEFAEQKSCILCTTEQTKHLSLSRKKKIILQITFFFILFKIKINFNKDKKNSAIFDE